MRVLVCGSRDYADKERLFHILDEVLMEAAQMDDGITLIHGAARGADSLADQWGRKCSPVEIERYPADWDRYGRRAGYVRNKQMLDEGRPDMVIAFYSSVDKSRGTSMMVDIAQRASVPVVEILP